jgi:hypothetical protein
VLGSGDGASTRIHAAVPEHATLILERLAGVRKPYSSLARLQDELERASYRPSEVTRLRRGVHLAIQGFFLFPGLILMFFLSCPLVRPRAFPWDLETVIAVPLFWVLWSILSRGGMSPTLAGLSLVRSDGRTASRMACGWRASLVWAPLAAMLAASRHLQEASPEGLVLYWSLWIGGLILLAACVVVAMSSPRRGPHDRLAGTVMVPL